jgi:hypothetical protein
MPAAHQRSAICPSRPPFDVAGVVAADGDHLKQGAQQLHIGHCCSRIGGGKVTDQFRQRLRHDPSAEDTIRCRAGGQRRSHVRFVDPSVMRSSYPPVVGVVIEDPHG